MTLPRDGSMAARAAGYRIAIIRRAESFETRDANATTSGCPVFIRFLLCKYTRALRASACESMRIRQEEGYAFPQEEIERWRGRCCEILVFFSMSAEQRLWVSLIIRFWGLKAALNLRIIFRANFLRDDIE